MKGLAMTVSAKITANVEKAKTLLAAGFTTKAAQNEALSALSRAADAIKDIYRDAYFAIAREEKNNTDKALSDWYYDFPALHVWKAKHVTTANSLYPELAAQAALMTELAALRLEIKNAPVVKVPSKAEQRAVVMETTARKGNAQLMTEALQEVKQDVINTYVDHAGRQIETIKTTLTENGMNMKVAYPERNSRQTPATITDATGSDEKGYYTRKFSAQKEAEYIEMNKASAAFSFASYIEKMAMKLGDKSISSVSFNGRIWNRCTVTITCDDGSVTKLDTQIIVNTSKKGKLFNQWPTRTRKA